MFHLCSPFALFTSKLVLLLIFPCELERVRPPAGMCGGGVCVWWRMTWAEVFVRMHGIFEHKSVPNERKCILTELVPREKEDIVVSVPKPRWFYSVKFVCLHAASAGAMAFYKQHHGRDNTKCMHSPPPPTAAAVVDDVSTAAAELTFVHTFNLITLMLFATLLLFLPARHTYTRWS